MLSGELLRLRQLVDGQSDLLREGGHACQQAVVQVADDGQAREVDGAERLPLALVLLLSLVVVGDPITLHNEEARVPFLQVHATLQQDASLAHGRLSVFVAPAQLPRVAGSLLLDQALLCLEDPDAVQLRVVLGESSSKVRDNLLRLSDFARKCVSHLAPTLNCVKGAGEMKRYRGRQKRTERSPSFLEATSGWLDRADETTSVALLGGIQVQRN